ncbi:SDR family oxidoreductase [Conexibacter woesei]|uniref:Short-chain dehydrogenase/reductase SDR n=1 Tax=Conexibacter woesei (strain DSM 14684 / CCUG 47730 / CIP 108061 / JCM 11494 / NBRC 100937 / ID131577) TaxID=469383 RepID=D3F3Q4_CONWI|nr:SDR family oxidoreductase [Conexibacter woesei]ADB52419.1 short-chain dehydrogenase/reductase SDR [Conexibacter woesei DSM 14684]
MNLDLSGKTAIVTGASRGIGLAVARQLADSGAHVVLTARKAQDAEAAAATIGERAAGFGAHATDEAAATACVAFAIERFGSLDVLVNNAGTNPALGPLAEMDHGRFAKTIDVNVWAPVLWTGLAWRAWMREHGGAVVNNASLGGIVTAPDFGVYHASKAALMHITRHAAVELAPRVRVNAVAPGVVRTRLAEALWKEQEDEIVARFPLGRVGEPDDVARAVTFLASDAAAWITGETLVVDGGFVLGTASVEAVATAGEGAR